MASDAFNATATRHGFRWHSWWDWQSTYDRFEVSALPAIASVAITPATATIPMNGGRIFSAQAFDAAGEPIPGVSFTWQSSNASVLSTRGASATMAAGIAEGVGSATITAVAFGGGAQGSASVTVSAPPPPPPPPPSCMGGVFPNGMTWAADGGIGQVTVSAAIACEWTTAVNVPWITPFQTRQRQPELPLTDSAGVSAGGATLRAVLVAVVCYIVAGCIASVFVGTMTGFPMRLIFEGDIWFIPGCGVLAGILSTPILRSTLDGKVWKQAIFFTIVSTCLLCGVWWVMIRNFPGI